MDGYKRINISDFINSLSDEDSKAGTPDLKTLLPAFSCPLNPDIENFYYRKAYEFDHQSIAKTTLVFASYKEQPVLVGYYTLANKFIVIRKGNISGNTWKRIRKFGTHNQDNACTISAPLIGQLGKNFRDGYNSLVAGDELLQMAIDDVKASQKIVGGKLVYLECEDKPRLIEFYNRNGFFEFDRRRKDSDEKGVDGNELIQMIAYL